LKSTFGTQLSLTKFFQALSLMRFFSSFGNPKKIIILK
jgi:hypothetical protein